MSNLSYLIALHAVSGLGPIRLKLVLDYFKDPKLAWESAEKELEEIGLPKNAVANLLSLRKTLNPEKYLDEILKSSIKILTIFDEDYPKLLKQIYDPPIVIYYVGELPQGTRTIGVVGTRKMTGYGKTVTDKFTKELVEAGFVIVSGLARGVDTQAHKSCLEAGGKTIAVLGGGLKKLFPPENKELAKKISQGFGAVISEFPPDEPSTPGNFPARNRIISGLSLGVLVTEADVKSGSLITARLAIEEGREVFAIPGPITSNLSAGTSHLIKEGAKLVTSAEDILNELGIEKNVIYSSPSAQNDKLSELEKQILECLESEQKHIDEVCRILQKPSSEISASLMKMEIVGLVKNMGGGVYIKSI